MKKLAVILPAYNAAPFIGTAIDSVLAQHFQDFDLYIYDDCSTDNTQEIVSGYVDVRIHYRRNDCNTGIAVTLNKALDELLPHYSYLARMDADDWCDPARFAEQLAFMEANPRFAMCGTQGYWLKNLDENPVSGWQYPVSPGLIKYNLFFTATFGHSSLMFRGSMFLDNGYRYDQDIATCEDWELWCRIALKQPLANLPGFLMKYRVVPTSNHRAPDKIKLHYFERAQIISRYWDAFGFVVPPEDVYGFYFDNAALAAADFRSRVIQLVDLFNSLHDLAVLELSPDEAGDFSYMLSRRILAFWKRSKASRINLFIWSDVVRRVRFVPKLKFIKYIVR